MTPFADFSSLANVSASWLAADWKFVLGTVVALGAVFWVRLRTGSSHVISKMILRRLLGQRATSASPLNEFLNERDDLMQFRALTGLKDAPTLAAAQRVAEWSRKHDLDIDTVSRAQWFIDFDVPGLKGKPPASGKIWAIEAAAVLFAAIAAFVLIVGSMTPAAVRVIATDLYYVVDHERAQRLPAFWMGGVRGFSKKQCVDQEAIVARTRYLTHDVNVLCKIFSDEDGLTAIGEARRAQIWLTAGLVACLFVLSWQLHRLLASVKASRSLHERMAERAIARAEAFLVRTQHLAVAPSRAGGGRLPGSHGSADG